MSGEANLVGQRVLVAEDDFLVPTPPVASQGWAKVLAPFPTGDRALKEVSQTLPTVAVVDINLGRGRICALPAEIGYCA